MIKRNMLWLAIGVILVALLAEGYYGFSVSVENVAVVVDDGSPVRVEEEGRHYYNPASQAIWQFPVMTLYKISDRPVKVASLGERYPIDVQYSLLWRICEPLILAKQIGRFEVAAVESELIDAVVEDRLKVIRGLDKTASKKNLVQVIVDTEIDVYERLKSRGICSSGLSIRGFTKENE